MRKPEILSELPAKLHEGGDGERSIEPGRGNQKAFRAGRGSGWGRLSRGRRNVDHVESD
jgi:hypothetical protein